MDFFARILFSGRWDIDRGKARASAPATAFEFAFEGTFADAEIEGPARWKVEIDGRELPAIESRERKPYRIADKLSPGLHRARVAKMTESEAGSVALYRINADAVVPLPGKGGPVLPKIAFIGDSYTVGYGNAAKGTSEGDAFSTTDATQSYGAFAARELGADFEIDAYSGRGLLKNYGGVAPGWTIPKLYGYTLAGEAPSGRSPEWDYSRFRPDAACLFVGINDWQGEQPHPDPREFDDAYIRFLDFLRKRHPGVRFLLLSTDVFPENRLSERIETILARELAAGNRDIRHRYLETPENDGLDFHPGIGRHRQMGTAIAGELRLFLKRPDPEIRI